MERVLVKATRPATAALPIRAKITIPMLSPVSNSHQGLNPIAHVTATEVAPSAVLKPAPDLSGSPSVLRRRMSVRDMGKTTELPHTTLLPGQRLE
jgi:hypothetical protein